MLCSEAVNKRKENRDDSPRKNEKDSCTKSATTTTSNEEENNIPQSVPSRFSLLTIQNQSINPNKEKRNLDDITTRLEPASVRFQQGHNNKQRKFQKWFATNNNTIIQTIEPIQNNVKTEATKHKRQYECFCSQNYNNALSCLPTHLHFLGCRSQHQCEKNRSRERHEKRERERERWIESARNGALKSQRDPKKRDNDPPSRYLHRSLQVPAVTTYPHNRLAGPYQRAWLDLGRTWDT